MEIKIAFNQKIWRDDFLGELDIFLCGQILGIELWNIFIWSNENSGYLRIQIYIESTKVSYMLTINSP